MPLIDHKISQEVACTCTYDDVCKCFYVCIYFVLIINPGQLLAMTILTHTFTNICPLKLRKHNASTIMYACLNICMRVDHSTECRDAVRKNHGEKFPWLKDNTLCNPLSGEGFRIIIIIMLLYAI